MANSGFAVTVNPKKLADFTASMQNLVKDIKDDLNTGALPRKSVSLAGSGLDFGQELPDFTAAVSLAKDYTDTVNALFDLELAEFASALAVLGEAAAAASRAYINAHEADILSVKSIDEMIDNAPMPPMPTSAFGGSVG